MQGADTNQIIGAVDYGKEWPGMPISLMQIVIATCWEEDPKERMKLLELLALFSAGQIGVVGKIESESFVDFVSESKSKI